MPATSSVHLTHDPLLSTTVTLTPGPGIDLSYGLYPGNTIQRETFETQFIQVGVYL